LVVAGQRCVGRGAFGQGNQSHVNSDFGYFLDSPRAEALAQHMEAPPGLRITSPQDFHVLRSGFSRAESGEPKAICHFKAPKCPKKQDAITLVFGRFGPCFLEGMLYLNRVYFCRQAGKFLHSFRRFSRASLKGFRIWAVIH